MKLSLGLGKYRDLLLAIFLFVVLDLGILFFNYAASLELERDARRINAAGELRMLTQQMTKALLTLAAEQRAQQPIQTSMAQLQQGHAGFEQALSDLKQSLEPRAELIGTAFNPEALRLLLGRLEREWQPLNASLVPLLGNDAPQTDDTDLAVTKAVARNVRLMALCDDLAQGVEAAANFKTGRMRHIQLGAIVLALLNFVYIALKFLRRLHASDALAEAARRETEDILQTVSEGLMLVHADGTVGRQLSASVHKLFMRRVVPGMRFEALLEDMLEPARAQEAQSYLSLLLDPKVKPALLSQLDPLREVSILAPAGAAPTARVLNFQIAQVRHQGVIQELLVTVFDVTQQVQLRSALVASQEAARSDLEDLIQVLEREPALLQDFLAGAREGLDTLNQRLRAAGRAPADYSELVHEAARRVHGIKGEASMLALGAVTRQAHQMEHVLAPLLTRRDLGGEDLIAVVFELHRLQEQLDRLHRVFDRLDRRAPAQPAPDAHHLQAMVDHLRDLSGRVAQAQNKQVRLSTRIVETELPPAVTQFLRQSLPQLVRNAVVHGIETPEERSRLGKPAVGELTLEIARTTQGALEVSLGDDGRGLDAPEVRERATRFCADAATMSDTQVLRLIFDPQYSSAPEVTEHAGRGVGLSLVRQLADAAGVKLRVLTRAQRYTRFVLQFPEAACAR